MYLLIISNAQTSCETQIYPETKCLLDYIKYKGKERARLGEILRDVPFFYEGSR